MKLIPLSRGKFAKVDDSDFACLSQHTWYCSDTGYAGRAIRLENGRQSQIKMHRVIMNPPKGFTVDHKNGDRLDNRRENLRIASISQQRQNAAAKRGTKTGAKCVRSIGNRFGAHICAGGKFTHLGTFDTVQEAQSAYLSAARLIYGEFATARRSE